MNRGLQARCRIAKAYFASGRHIYCCFRISLVLAALLSWLCDGIDNDWDTEQARENEKCRCQTLITYRYPVDRLNVEAIGDFHGKYFVTFLGEASMANRLAMDRTHGILQLFAAGMSERQIARTLNIG